MNNFPLDIGSNPLLCYLLIFYLFYAPTKKILNSPLDGAQLNFRRLIVEDCFCEKI